MSTINSYWRYDLSNGIAPAHTAPVSYSSAFKRIEWSPDGAYLLTNSVDNALRMHQMNAELSLNSHPSISVKHPENISDFTWYPGMSSASLESCVFLSCSKTQPIKAFNAYDGSLKCAYSAYDQFDEVCGPNSVAYSVDGTRIYAGLTSSVQVFETDRPGRAVHSFNTNPSRKSTDGIKGLVSTISISRAQPSLYALGFFTSMVAFYTETSDTPCGILKVPGGGVSDVKFAANGVHVWTSARRNNQLLCWDLRMLHEEPVFSVTRPGMTNQRLYFDLDTSGRYVATGDENGSILVNNLHDENSETVSFASHSSPVASVAWHPSLPILTSASGRRQFDDEENLIVDNSLKLWTLSVTLTN